MKTNLMYRPCLLFSLLLVLLSSCEHLFDEVFEKNPEYAYLVKNETNSPVQVVVEVKESIGMEVVGDGKFYYTIAPGSTLEVWTSGGSEGSQVWDKEEDNEELSGFTLTATSNSRPNQLNLGRTHRWVYHEESKYKATYTLTLTEDDF